LLWTFITHRDLQ